MNFIDAKTAVAALENETIAVSQDTQDKLTQVVATLTDHRWTMRTLPGVLKRSPLCTEDDVALFLIAFIEQRKISVYPRHDGKVFYHYKGHRAQSQFLSIPVVVAEDSEVEGETDIENETFLFVCDDCYNRLTDSESCDYMEPARRAEVGSGIDDIFNTRRTYRIRDLVYSGHEHDVVYSELPCDCCKVSIRGRRFRFQVEFMQE